jgi:hypothetical protein
LRSGLRKGRGGFLLGSFLAEILGIEEVFVGADPLRNVREIGFEFFDFFGLEIFDFLVLRLGEFTEEMTEFRLFEDFAVAIYVDLCARNDPDGADAREDAATCRRLMARRRAARRS